MSHPNFIGRYDLGQTVQMLATVVGSDGAPKNPSAFQFLVRDPRGSVASYLFGAPGASIINPAVGVFIKDLEIAPTGANAGSWFYRAHATGLVQAAEKWSFFVSHDETIV